jgi:dihydropteroate synthase
VDTYRTEVARRAIAAGADIINDTSGLYDPTLADVVAKSDATLIITHSLARPPRTPVLRPSYQDVVAEVVQFLRNQVNLAISRGVSADRIIVDPGHDLNKNTYHSLELTRRFREVAALGYPTLAAVSNKDFIGETLDVPENQRLEGTIAANVVCILQGARIIRVHDVSAAISAVRVTETILGWRPPSVARHNLA